jgi:putative spermidine/putrescine transport system permease protein
MQKDETVSAWSRAWLIAIAAAIAFYLVLPILVIVPMSFTDAAFLKFPPPRLSWRWYEAFLGSERWMDALRTSLIVAAGTVAVATPLGTLAAWGVFTSRSRWADLVWLAIMAPLVVPIVLIGISLFFVYARFELNGTLTGLILAHAMHAVPYVFVTVASGLATFDANQPRVAQSLGASPFYAFMTVTLPQIRFSVLAGAFLAFLASFDEVVIALFVSGGEHTTLPKLMFQELRLSLDPTIAAVSSLMLLVALTVLVVSQVLSARERSARTT